MFAREAEGARQGAEDGYHVRLWSLPGQDRNLGLWQSPDPERLQQVLQALPMAAAGWMTVETVPLTRHPSDPATATA